ncbi:MAG: hypothetical protein ABIO19_08725 [Burkholderiaceae bacterium]
MLNIPVGQRFPAAWFKNASAPTPVRPEDKIRWLTIDSPPKLGLDTYDFDDLIIFATPRAAVADQVLEQVLTHCLI